MRRRSRLLESRRRGPFEALEPAALRNACAIDYFDRRGAPVGAYIYKVHVEGDWYVNSRTRSQGDPDGPLRYRFREGGGVAICMAFGAFTSTERSTRGRVWGVRCRDLPGCGKASGGSTRADFWCRDRPGSGHQVAAAGERQGRQRRFYFADLGEAPMPSATITTMVGKLGTSTERQHPVLVDAGGDRYRQTFSSSGRDLDDAIGPSQSATNQWRDAGGGRQ